MKFRITANKQINSVIDMEIEADNKDEALEKARLIEYDEIDEYDSDVKHSEFQIENLCSKCKEKVIAETSKNKDYPNGICKDCYDIENM